MKLISIFGAGLLVGTALAVIIPEGVNSMYNFEPLTKVTTEQIGNKKLLEVKNKGQEINIESAGDNLNKQQKEKSLEAGHHDHGGSMLMIGEEQAEAVHKKIGLALVAGFIVMLLVDHGFNITCCKKSKDVESNGSVSKRKGYTATVGLVVHAAADGIALGAASSISQVRVEMIVFVAIMLHKGPAAFGLVSFLLHDGVDRIAIRKHLLVFSVSAPLLAIITYFCLSSQNKAQLAELCMTGFALLFSGGTFLYVATVHVLPEILQDSTDHHHHQNKVSGSSGGLSSASEMIIHEQKGFTCLQIALLMFGSAIPLVLSLGHSH